MRHPLEEELLKGGKADEGGRPGLVVKAEGKVGVEVEAEPGDGVGPTGATSTKATPTKEDLESEEDRSEDVILSLVVAVGQSVLAVCLLMAFVRVLLGDEVKYLVWGMVLIVCIQFVPIFSPLIDVSLARVARTSPLIVSALALAAILVNFLCPPRGKYPVFTPAVCLTLATSVTISCLALCAHVARAKRYREATEQVKRHFCKFLFVPLFVVYIFLTLLLIAGIIGADDLIRSHAALATPMGTWMLIMCTQMRLAGLTGADEFANEAAKWAFLIFGIVFLIFLSINWPAWY